MSQYCLVLLFLDFDIGVPRFLVPLNFGDAPGRTGTGRLAQLTWVSTFLVEGNSTALKLNVQARGILDKAMLHGCVHLLSPLPLSGQSKGEKAVGWA